ncbi:MAG: hypothetical protein WCX93_06255 [Burkholderiaceae bacterium]
MSSSPLQKSMGPTFKSIHFNARHLIETLLLSGVVYGSFLLLAFLFSRVGIADHLSLAVAHLGGAAALLTCWRFGRWGRARVVSFGAALLLIGTAFRLHAAVDAVVYGTRVENMYRYWAIPISDPVIDLLLKGELITVTGMLLVACSWRLSVGSRVEQFSFLENVRQVPVRVAWLVYISAMMVDVTDKLFGISFGPFSQILSLLFGFGVAAIYFIARVKEQVVRQVVTASLLALPMFILAIGSGMKEEMLFPFIPAAVLYWMGFNNVVARVAAIIMGFVLLAFSQLYVQYVREATWGSAGQLDVSRGELIEGFSDQVDTEQSTDAINSISSRINQTIAHATTTTLADNKGHEPMEVFGPIPASVIPRALWRGKPVLQPGAMHTARILGGHIPLSQITSATAAGFFTEMYLGGWWLGVVLGSIIYGVMLAGAQKWVLRTDSGFSHQALCFITLYWTLRFDENHVVYAYTAIIFTVVFIWMLGAATKAMGLRRTRPVESQIPRRPNII